MIRRNRMLGRRMALALLAAPVLAGCGVGSFLQTQTEPPEVLAEDLSGPEVAVARWVAGQAVPVGPLQQPVGPVEQAALEGVAREATVVALGEATHGNREIFEWKRRVVASLVERSG